MEPLWGWGYNCRVIWNSFMNKESFVLIVFHTATFSIQWSFKVFVKWLLYCHCWKSLCCFCSLVSGVAVCWAMSMGIMPALLLLYLKVFKLDKLSWPGNFTSYLFSLFGSTENCCFRVFTRSIVRSLHDPRYPGTRTSQICIFDNEKQRWLCKFCMWGFFILVLLQSFSLCPWHEMTCFAFLWMRWTHDDKFSHFFSNLQTAGKI